MLNDDFVGYIDLKLAALGHLTSRHTASNFLEIVRPLLRNFYQKGVMLGSLLCPADRRIQAFLDDYLKDIGVRPEAHIPEITFLLDRPGLARVLSLPPGSDSIRSPYLQSFRVPQGILHNPKSDRRTTKGIFHIVEGGFPAPGDKRLVPKKTFAELLAAAFNPPPSLMKLPFCACDDEAASLFVSLLLRPIVCPATEREPEKTMEIRFFAPGSLVSNLDFVEGILGNGGDPYLAESDSALDVMRWTGHTGCVIVAPHLTGIKKNDVGLPHEEDATERQRRDGMFWRDAEEPYNDGHVMALGNFEGVGIGDPHFRVLFRREDVVKSEWYRQRLHTKQKRDVDLWRRHAAALATFQQQEERKLNDCPFDLQERVDYARAQFSRVSSPAYLDELRGTIGADPFFGQVDPS